MTSRPCASLVAEFTKAFNADDSKAIAAMFTSDARMVTMTGRVIQWPCRDRAGLCVVVPGVPRQHDRGEDRMPPLPRCRFGHRRRHDHDHQPTDGQRPARFHRDQSLLRCLRQARRQMASGQRPRLSLADQHSSSRLTNISRSWNGWLVTGLMRATKPRCTPPAAGPRTNRSCCDRFRSGAGARPSFPARSESAGIPGSSRFAPGFSTPTGAFPKVSLVA